MSYFPDFAGVTDLKDLLIEHLVKLYTYGPLICHISNMKDGLHFFEKHRRNNLCKRSTECPKKMRTSLERDNVALK